MAQPFDARRLMIGVLVLGGLAAWRMWPAAPGVASGAVTVGGTTMGTAWSLVAVAPRGSRPALQALVQASLDGVDGRMSTWKPDSELSRLVAHAGTDAVPASPELREVLRLAREVSEASAGAFDVTVGPLVDAWGFGPDGRRGEPDDETLDQLTRRVGYRHLEVDDAVGSVRKRIPDLSVDLSAIAKGWGADQAAAALRQAGYRDFLLEVGGEVVAAGQRVDGAAWCVGVERPDPDRRAVHTAVGLRDLALATSGDYRNFFEAGDGRRRSHTIDPRTGRPVAHGLASVSVVSERCAHADAWATALTVLGPKAGVAVAERLQLAARFVTRDADGTLTVTATPGFEALLLPSTPAEELPRSP